MNHPLLARLCVALFVLSLASPTEALAARGRKQPAKTAKAKKAKRAAKGKAGADAPGAGPQDAELAPLAAPAAPPSGKEKDKPAGIVASEPAFDEAQLAGRIRIDTPARVVLGRDKQAQVNLLLPGSRNLKAPVLVEASAGSVGDLSDTGQILVGSWKAPEAFHPHVALLAAAARIDGKPAVGFKILPLMGAGSLTVKASPGAKVYVRIGPETFGPATADRNGNAEVPVAVAPGYDAATVVETGRTIPLPVAPFRRVVAIAADGAVAADGVSSTELFALAVDKMGRPDPMVYVSFKAARGTIGPISRRGSGVFAASYTPPESMGDGADVISYGLVGDQMSRGSFKIKLVQGAPRQLRVRLDPPVYTSGSPPPSATVVVEDAGGNLVDALVDFSVDAGKVGATKRTGPGRYTAALAPPEQFGALKEVKVLVLARSPGTEPARAAATLPLKPGRPFRLEAKTEEDGAVAADGASTVPIHVRVLDQNGNLVPNAAVSATADAGEVQPPRAAADGTVLVNFRPPVSFEEKTAAVSVAAGGGVSARVPLRLLPAKRSFALAFKGGFSSNLSGMHVPMAGLELSYRLRFITPLLQLALEGGVMRYPMPGQAPLGDARVVMLAFPVSLSLRLEAPAFGPHLLAYLGAAPVADVVSVQGETPTPSGAVRMKETAVVVGGQAHLGFGYRFGRSSLALEMRYMHVEARDTTLVTGQLGGASAALVYGVEL